jgi:hypothetical protein
MQEKEFLTSNEVLKMLERPVVMAYGRETFNRLLRNPSHMLIHAYNEEEDYAILKWCASILERKGIFVYFDTEKTKCGQWICRLVAGNAGWLYGKACYHYNLLKRAHDYIRKHRDDLPPEVVEELERKVDFEGSLFELLGTLIRLEDEYNTHLGFAMGNLISVYEEGKYVVSVVADDLRVIRKLLPNLLKHTQDEEGVTLNVD